MDTSYSTWSKNDLQLVEVNTRTLKNRLNRLYETRRHNTTNSNDGLFEYLWDLKEKALMEGKASVEVPGNWLDELEQTGARPLIGH